MMDGTFFFYANRNGARLMNPNRPWQSHVFQGRWVPVHLVARCAPLRFAPRSPRPIVEPSPGNGPTMKDQLGVMQYQPLAVGRDNGVTALRHDTPISVSQAEDEVMVGFGLASVSDGHGNAAPVFAGEWQRCPSTRARARRRKWRRDRSNPWDFPPSNASARGLDNRDVVVGPKISRA